MNDNPRLRLGVLGLVALSLFATLFARLWYLQVLAHDQFTVRASANSTRTILEPAPRGRILDRNGKVIVDNRMSVVVTVDRAKLPKEGSPVRDVLLSELAAEITRYDATGKVTTRQEIEDKLHDVRYSPYTPVPVAEDVSKELEIYISEHREDLGAAIDVASTTIRNYPFGRTAAHVLGYVGSITQEELDVRKDNPKPYSLQDAIGKSGIERGYEADLRGTPGEQVLEVDAKGNTVRQLSYTPPIPGDDVVLTIDADVQATAEKSLADGLQQARGRPNTDGSPNTSPAGSTVVLDPKTGQLIAMASFPDYDPAQFTRPLTQQFVDDLFNNPDNRAPLNNRAIQGQYAPGSTFKLITAYAALTSGAITPETTINDTGVFTVPGCRGEQCSFRNAGGAKNGSVKLATALTVSSDVFFYRLGAQFWQERTTYGDPIQKAATAFGLGEPTGIALPGELTGWVPTPDNKKQRNIENPEAFPYGDWFTGDNVNLAIGQGDMLVTPLQLANAYAALANGGTLYAPNLVKEVRRGGTDQVLRTNEPRTLKTVDLPPEVRDPIMEGLTGVTQSRNGTAYAAFVGFPQGWPVAGKTGTAQVTGGSDNALFVGMGPAYDPQYVSVAVLENSGFGAQAAAPVVRRELQGLADPTLQPRVQPGGQLQEPAGAVAQIQASGVQD